MADTNFHQLLIFHNVAQLGSFTKAARGLNISQPAVSIQVKELERSLNTVLVNRVRRGVFLTDAGEVVYGYTKRIFSLSDEMRLAVQDLEGLQAGKLTVGSSSTPGEYILPLAMGIFRERYPKIEISLAISNTETIVQQILSHELDLGMAGADVEIQGLSSFPYVEDEVVVVASPTHALSRDRRWVSLQEIASQPLIMREVGSATRNAASDFFKAHNMEVNIAMELGSNEAVKRAAAAGLGLGLLSKFSVGPDVVAGFLSVLRVRGWKCERPLIVFYRDDGHISTVQQAFLRLLQVERPLPPVPLHF